MRVRDRSFVIMLGQATTQASAIVASIILVRLISQESFGTYRQVLLVYTTLTAFISIQLEQSLYYFVPKLPAESRRSLVTQTVVAAIGLAVLGSVGMFAAAGLIADYFDNPALERLLRVFALFPLAEGVSVLVPAYMIGLDRAIRGSVYSMVKALLRLGGVVTVFASGGSIESVLWVVMAVSGLIALVGTVDMVRVAGSGAFRLRRAMLAEQLRYAVPLWMGSVVGTLSVQYDKVLISTVFDPATYAVYFCGAMELPVVALVTASISAAMMPRLVGLVGDRMGDALDLWQEGIRKASLIVFPCFAFFLPVSRDFMVLLYGEDYAMAAWPFAIYLCLLPIRVAVYATLFRALGKTRPIAVCGMIALVVNVVVSTSLVVLGKGTHLSFVGPSIGTVAAEASAATYLLFSLSGASGVRIGKLMRWAELGRVALPCAVAGVVVYAISVFLPALLALPLAAKLLLELLVFAALVMALVAVTGLLKDDERELLKTPLELARRAWGRRE